MNDAVSSVVSAVLVVTLFTAAFGVWAVDTLPEWVADREDSHAKGVGVAMGDATSDILAVAAADRTGTTTLSVPLAPEKIPLVQPARATGALEIVPDFGYTFSAPDHLAVMAGGAMRIAPSASSLDDIQSIIALDWAVSGSAQLSATDGPTTVTAQSGPCSGDSVTIDVTLGTATTTTTIPCATGGVVNMLTDQLRFAAYLEELEAPFTITATGSSVAAAWRDSSGLTRTTASGVGGSTWSTTGDDLASLRYDPSFRSLDDRQVIMEGGAVINVQEEGASFTATPPILLGVDQTGTTDTAGYLSWTLVAYQGDGAVSGSSVATARLNVLSQSDRIIHVDGADVTFALDSLAPAAWVNGWEHAASLAGADSCSSGPSYTTDSTASSATLTLKSCVPWTIHLTVIHVDVSVS